MQKLLFLLIALLAGAAAYAQPPAGAADKGDFYGAKTTGKGAITTAQLADKMAKTDSLQTKVTGKVVGVCPKKGCWWSLELPDKSVMFVKSKDYDIFVPTALKGKTIVMEGLAFNKVTSVAELKHYAEDAKRPQSEIDAIKEPKKEIRFQPKSVTVL